MISIDHSFRPMTDKTDAPSGGASYGDIRAPLPLERLEPYLLAKIPDLRGPITVKQFKVSCPPSADAEAPRI